MSDYNGWTNYATWRVNLEIVDPGNGAGWLLEAFDEKPEPYELSQFIKSEVEMIVAGEDADCVLLSTQYAMAFLSDVNWYEIAEVALSDWDDDDDEV